MTPADELTRRPGGGTYWLEDSAVPDRITDLLASWLDGDKEAGDRLFIILYDQLRRLARARLRRGRGPACGSLDTVALVHDAYIKLTVGSRLPVQSRAHFLALASRTMRQVVLDHARRRTAQKREGDLVSIVSLDPAAPDGMSADDLLALNEALGKLETLEPRLARIVEMRFFGGMTIEEVAEVLELSVATIKRSWLRARAFLFQHVHPSGD